MNLLLAFLKQLTTKNTVFPQLWQTTRHAKHFKATPLDMVLLWFYSHIIFES
ncbi:hypothetical protein HMPREF3214_00363 [Alloscardovia omnicolens]|uniref:Uncharacterized protein n=1 Tax=Alloscardovia omnicolens F0580 TaxID=1321816 RepID=U1QUW8_9BIFI|nr:hypothetical protein HMPREF9244_00647 [Alloscardovia omnicolens F0580]KWZ75603.1 hypothetical protein HMPREF3214_00363 [Alloscardovia omnicolens]